MKVILSSRRYHHLARFYIFLVIVALIAGMVGCNGNGGTPSEDIEIRTWYDLDAVRDNMSGNYTLMNDLDPTTPGYEELASPTANNGTGWEPIGTDGSEHDEFTGTFDGQGYEIRDLFINRPDKDSVGLFGHVDIGARIEDTGVVNADVTGRWAVGGLVGWNFGIVSDSYSTGNVTCTVTCVGGLVGANYGGTVSNSYSTATVTGEQESLSVGGLLGWNNGGTVSNSYSTGNVTGGKYVGGLIGHHEGTVSNSYSTGTATGEQDVGGLIGHHEGTVSNSYYNYDGVLINGENIITIGALFGEDFDEWLTNNKFLDVNERLSQENGYYVLNNVNDFKELLAFGQDSSLKFRLKNDLDLETEPNFYIPYLAGEFDGNGHKISNLTFNFDYISNIGLFAYLAPSGNVTWVGVESVDINGRWFIGGLVGHSFGTVSKSHCIGNVTGDSYVGGLVGDNRLGTVSDCYSSCNANGNIYSNDIGGLIGRNIGTIRNSYSTGNVFGGTRIGGLVGSNDGAVTNSYSTGYVTGSSDVGGLVGLKDGTVYKSFWDTETSGQSTSDGGTGKTTAEMQEITTFSSATWDIVGVVNPSIRNTSYIWNIVDEETYPFLSWQPVS